MVNLYLDPFEIENNDCHLLCKIHGNQKSARLTGFSSKLHLLSNRKISTHNQWSLAPKVRHFFKLLVDQVNNDIKYFPSSISKR
jgi:hypothetical protein